MAKGTYNNSYNRNKVRIDTRSQSDPAVQAGMRGIRRNLGGQVVGGITAEGQRIGTARQNKSVGGFRQSGGFQPNPTSNPNFVAPATGSTLQGRQSLFRKMTQAGANFLTPEMREEGKRLGVTDQAFNAAAGRLAVNQQITPPRTPAAAPAPGAASRPTTPAVPAPAPAAATPAAPAPTPSTGRVLTPAQAANAAQNKADGVTRSDQTGSRAAEIAAAGGDPAKMPTDTRMVAQGKVNAPKPAAPAPAKPAASTGPRINKLTGLPFGYRPGDKVDAPQAAAARESVSNQGSASAFGGIEARPSDLAGADNAMRSQGINIPQKSPTSRFRGSSKRQDPTEAGGAFSREAYAKTAAAQQEGYDKEAIRKGTASEATKKKWKTYAAERARGVKMDAEIAKGQSYGGKAPVVGGPGFYQGGKVTSIRPGSRFRKA